MIGRSKFKTEIQKQCTEQRATQIIRWPDHPITSARDFFQSLLVDIEVGMDVLHIFVVFERLHQADHLRRLLPFQLDVGIGNHGHARGSG
ncbi:MAG: hypothetical protein ABR988_02575, partial [Terriglobales bacterium]